MSAQHTSGGDVQSRPLKAANDGLTVHSRPHLGADTALVIKLFSIQSFSSSADARSNADATIGSLCSSLEPFRAASNCRRSISYHTSTWISPQPPASSCASEREGVQTFLCRSAQRRPRGRHQGLEADSAVYRSYQANFKENKFSKNNQFPSLISSSFIFAILSVVSVNFPPFEHSNF